MITIQGKGVSVGIAMGPLYFYHRPNGEIHRYEVFDTKKEWERFLTAQTETISQLDDLIEKASVEAGEEVAALFEAHQMMAEDLDYVEMIQR